MGNYRIVRQQVGQLNAVEILPATKLVIGAKTFSPDGTYVYFTARSEGETTSQFTEFLHLEVLRKKLLKAFLNIPHFVFT